MSKLVYLFPAINGFAVVILGLARIDWPDPTFWTKSAVIGALVVTGAIPTIQAFISERGERRRRVALEREQTIRTCLAAALVVLARDCGANWETTGVQAFGLKRIAFSFNPWKIWRLKQVRLSKLRLGAIPASGITWTKGKGLIGRCWDTKAPQWEKLNLHFAPFMTLTRAEWESYSPERVYGLSYDDFQATKGKFGLVAAVPIIGTTGQYLGCITMDTPASSSNRIDKNKAIQSLSLTADLVKTIIER